MEDYEKKYKEALSRAATELETCGADKSLRNMIYAIFPDEIKEPEDERIRKALIRFHASTIDIDGIQGKEILAWLEKQGEQKPIMNVPTREVILSIWDLGNEWKELTNGSISTEYGTQLDYIQKHWYESEYYLREKQGDTASDIRYEVKAGDSLSVVNGKPFDYEHATITQKDFACDAEEASYTAEVATGDGSIKTVVSKKVSLPNPQSKEWSDEDENYLQSAENACEYQYGKNTSTILWLKRLKDRIGG